MPTEFMVIEIMQIAVTGIVVLALGIPIIRLIARRMDRQPVSLPLGAVEQRLERIEQAVETMAVEVERISEGQRFATRLLAERAGERGASAERGAGRPGGERDAR